LTAAPLAVLVAEGCVVVVLVDVLVEALVDGVLVDGTVELAGERSVDGLDGALVDGALPEFRVVVDGDSDVLGPAGSEVAPLEFVAGGEPAAIDELEEPRVTDALGREPRVRGADFV